MLTRHTISIIRILLMLSLVGATCQHCAEEVVLASDNKAAQRIIVAANASPRVRSAADTLARYLKQISGADFQLGDSDGAVGIAVGTAADFPKLPFAEQLTVHDIPSRERYVLRTHSQGVYIIGATSLAVEHAVWNFLYRLGYRQFFPGEVWEIVPKLPVINVNLNIDTKPQYWSRRIWCGYGVWNHRRDAYDAWCARNRAVEGFNVNNGHAYDGIIERNKAEFAAHPEYLGMVKNERKSSKFCISNHGLRKLVVGDALAQFKARPDRDSLSVEPSDGGGWCECKDCAALGSITDRAALLANDVATAVQQQYPEKSVAYYAYASHSPPPSIQMQPNIIVSIATAFVRGGYSVDELFAGWSKAKIPLGVREYYSVNTWDRDLPGDARATKIDYLKKTIPEFYGFGARFMSAESSDNWGPNGLGYYLAARMLWDTNEHRNIDALVSDFLTRAFGEAEQPMREFYRMLNGSNRVVLSDDMVGRMYRCLKDARTRTSDVAVHARLQDLVLYTHYVELYRAYSDSSGPERQTAYEALIRFAYRIRKTSMIHSLALIRDLQKRDKTVKLPAECQYKVVESKNPWISNEPFTQEQIVALLDHGIAAHKLVDFVTIDFGTDYIPAGTLRISSVEERPQPFSFEGRSRQTFYTWIEKAPAEIRLKVTGGLIAHYRNRGDATVAIFPLEHEEQLSVDLASTPPDGKERELVLKTNYAGLHRIEVTDGGDKTGVVWPETLPLMIPCTATAPARVYERRDFAFLVPKGTTVIGGYIDGEAELLQPDGKKVATLKGKSIEYFSIPVGASTTHSIWRLKALKGRIALLTVPPCLSPSAAQLLIPKDLETNSK
jgi:hypothetical protein